MKRKTIIGQFQDIENAMKEAVKLAPETPSKEEKAEMKFQKEIDNPALTAAQGWSEKTQSEQDSDAKLYFSADVGEARTGHIDAECYDSNVGNSSIFCWIQGSDIIESGEIQTSKQQNSFLSETGQGIGYTEKFDDLLNQYEACLDQTPFGEEEGFEQANQVLADLDFTDMELLSSEEVLWFPKGAILERTAIGTVDDLFWQGDLGQAETGCQYIFSPSINGISVGQENGVVTEKTVDSYSPPFPVETITITESIT